jgi:hypothetical protein
MTLQQSSAVHIQALISADVILPGSSFKLQLLVINLASVPGGQLVNTPTAQSPARLAAICRHFAKLAMNLFRLFYKKKTNHDKIQLTQELIGVLKAVKANIRDDSDCMWSYFETPHQARNEIDKYVTELEVGNISSLVDLSTHFAPTSGYQGLSLQNGWSDEYMKLAERFDNIQSKLKN